MAVLDELRAIEERDGILQPKAVVEFARNPETELHSRFEWDNEKAGDSHRLWQARQLISVQVTYLKSKSDNVESPAFVSLVCDRNAQGGYRSIANVLSDDDLREKMLRDARRDLNIFKRRYQNLVELANVFQEIERVLV